MTSYPAGWYPDYSMVGQQRYWDGEEWTHYVHLPDDGASTKRRKLPKFKPSAQLVSATYRLLFADRSMIVLLLLGSVLAALAGAVIAFPAVYWGHVVPTWSGGGVVGVLVAGASLGAATFVIQLVLGAVVATAVLRAEGRDATARDGLRVAWSRRRALLAWALVSTLVGVVVRSLERTGAGGFVAALTLNLGWAVATVFATPVIIVEGTMPAATLKRSASILRERIAVTLISSVVLALPWLVLGAGAMLLALLGGAALAFAGALAGQALGAVMLAAGLIGVVYVGAVSSALHAFLETYLYRHALGLPVPGVDQHWLPPRQPR